jgi:hypothetical protein
MKALKTLVLVIAAMLPCAALGQTRTTTVSVGTVCNAVTHAAARNCEIRNVNNGIYGVQGFNLLTLEIFQNTDGAGGSTGYSFYLQACSEGLTASDCTDTADWYTIQGESYASGTLTLADGLMSKTVTANTDSTAMWSVGINYVRLRLYNISALTETNDADDTFTVKAWLATSPSF